MKWRHDKIAMVVLWNLHKKNNFKVYEKWHDQKLSCKSA